MSRSYRRNLSRSAHRLQSIASALTGYAFFLVMLVSAGVCVAMLLAPHVPA